MKFAVLYKKLGVPEKILLLLALAYGAAFLWPTPSDPDPIAPSPRLVIRGLVGLMVYVVGIIVAFRLILRGIRKAIWRLRNRLIVSYLFIAVVPMTLMLTLVGLGLYALIGQTAIYSVNAELDRRLASKGAGGRMPNSEMLADLVPGLGDVFLIGDDTNFAAQNFRRVHVPPPLNRFDIEVTWIWPVTFESKSVVLAVRSRPSAVLRHLFGQSAGDWAQTVLLGAYIVGGFFLAALLTSVIIGVSITRSITAAVHQIYEGTQRVRQGDFTHRISLKGNDQLAEVSTSFNQMTGNLQRLIEVEKEKERLHSELEIAREVQGRLFPKSAPILKTLELTGVCHAAQMVSGDYYDFVAMDGSGLALAIGDVAGKGISAALLMAAIQSVMRTQLTDATSMISPAKLVTLLNRQLYANTSPEKYATFFFGIYDDATSTLTYTNAGHLPPILVRAGRASLLEVTGTVVGAFPMVRYEERRLILEPGDLLMAYTDGITEPENAYGEMFGEERLMDLLIKFQGFDANEIIARIAESVEEWTSSSEQQDDMTTIVARRVA